MSKELKITAVCGWAIPENWFQDTIRQSSPPARVRALYPSDPFNSEEARKMIQENPADLFIGYSLGSLWLAHHQKFLPPDSRKVLIAPILGFAQEQNLGGKLPRAQLEVFIRTVRRADDLGQVLKDFLALGNLFLPESAKREIPEREVLVRGLEFLRDISVDTEQAAPFVTLLGDQDPFSDREFFSEHVQQTRILKNCGHQPQPLLDELFKITETQKLPTESRP